MERNELDTCTLAKRDSSQKRTFLISLIALLALPLVGSATAADETDLLATPVIAKERITLKQWQDLRAEILSKPELERLELGHQLILISSVERKTYRFTQPGHPAHPAVVVLSSVDQGVGAEIRRAGYFAGDMKAFDGWWQEFDRLNGIH